MHRTLLAWVSADIIISLDLFCVTGKNFRQLLKFRSHRCCHRTDALCNHGL